MALELLRAVTELPDVCDGVKLSCADVATLFALAHFGNLSEGGRAWPSVQRLSAVSRLSERSLERAFIRLERAGLLTRQRRHNRSTVYHLDRLFALHLAALGGDRTRQNGGYGDRSRQNGGYAESVPAKSASVPAKSASVPAILTGRPVKLADYPLKDPLKDPFNNPSEAKSVPEGTLSPRNPESGTGAGMSGEGGACAPGARNPERFSEGCADAHPPGVRRALPGGGSTFKPSVLHISQDPAPRPVRSFREAHADLPPSEYTEEVRALNRARLQAAIRGSL